jgi:hypothetical protein
MQVEPFVDGPCGGAQALGNVFGGDIFCGHSVNHE